MPSQTSQPAPLRVDRREREISSECRLFHRGRFATAACFQFQNIVEVKSGVRLDGCKLLKIVRGCFEFLL
jgi:hypothetical protein